MSIKEKIQEALVGALKEFSYDPPREVYSECRMDWDINLFSKNDAELEDTEDFVVECKSAICDLETIVMSGEGSMWPDVFDEIKNCFSNFFENMSGREFFSKSSAQLDLEKSNFYVKVYEVIDDGADVWRYHMKQYIFSDCLENND